MPIGRDHGGGKMPAGRVAVDQHPLPEALPQEHAGAPDLLDDVADGDDRTQIIARHRDGDAAAVEAARHVAEIRWIERAPIAAMDEDRQRSRLARLRQEEIERLPRRVAIGEAELGAVSA